MPTLPPRARPPKPARGPHARCRWDRAAKVWRVRLTFAGRKLVEEYLAKYPEPQVILGRRYPKFLREAEYRIGRDGVVAAAAVGVANAVRCWRPERATLPTVVTWHVFAAIQKEAWPKGRTLPPGTRIVSLEALMATPGGDRSEPPARPEPDTDDIEDAAYRVAGLMKGLPPKQAEAVRLLYGVGTGERRTLAEVGRVLGCGRVNVQSLVARAMATMRERAGVAG